MKGILGTENISVIYDKGTPKEFSALKGITFSALSGEFVIVFGPSGCGKSTLLYMLSGIERHIDSGEAWVNSKDITHMNTEGLLGLHRKDIGMIFQAYNLVSTLNVIHNVTLPLLAMGVPKSKRRERALVLLERFGVAHLARRYPPELSGGQQQRVAIARSLITDPEIIFADEPTGNLDSASTEVVLKQLLDLRAKDKKTILMVTHDPTFLHYADRVVWLKDGKLVKIDEQKGDREFTAIPSAENPTASLSVKTKPEENFGTSPFDKEPSNEMLFEEIACRATVTQFVHSFSEKKEPILQHRLEHILSEFILKKLLRKNTLFVLGQSIVDGGMGFLEGDAITILTEVEKLFEIRNFLLKFEEEKRLSYEVLLSLSEWALGPIFKKMTSVQVDRFCGSISGYLLGHIDNSSFSYEIKSSLERGGSGLFGVSSEPIIKKLELIEDLIPPEDGVRSVV